MPWTAPLKTFASRILQLAATSKENQDDGHFVCATMDGPRKMVLIQTAIEDRILDSGYELAFEEDLDETGTPREGAETWKVRVSLISTKDDGRAGHYGEYVKKKPSESGTIKCMDCGWTWKGRWNDSTVPDSCGECGLDRFVSCDEEGKLIG